MNVEIHDIPLYVEKKVMNVEILKFVTNEHELF
jgi:hypothetical protein